MSTPNALPNEQQILDAAQKAGLWPNTVHRWIPAFHRYHKELAAIAEASTAMKPLTCIWTEQDDDDMPGTYASACGEMWSFNNGGLAENNVRFCQGCGKPIEVTKAAP